MHTVNVILHETLEIYLTPKHSLCACKLSPYSCRLGAHGLCESLESDCTQQVCTGLSVPFVLFIATSMGS